MNAHAMSPTSLAKMAAITMTLYAFILHICTNCLYYNASLVSGTNPYSPTHYYPHGPNLCLVFLCSPSKPNGRRFTFALQ